MYISPSLEDCEYRNLTKYRLFDYSLFVHDNVWRHNCSTCSKSFSSHKAHRAALISVQFLLRRQLTLRDQSLLMLVTHCAWQWQWQWVYFAHLWLQR